MNLRHRKFTIFLILVSRLAVASLLLTSGVLHIFNPILFSASIASYQLLPMWAVGISAAILPCLHLACGLGVLLDPGRRAYSLIAATLFALYASAQIIVWVLGREISCGCFGFNTDPIGLRSIAPALLGLAAAIALSQTLKSLEVKVVDFNSGVQA